MAENNQEETNSLDSLLGDIETHREVEPTNEPVETIETVNETESTPSNEMEETTSNEAPQATEQEETSQKQETSDEDQNVDNRDIVSYLKEKGFEFDSEETLFEALKPKEKEELPKELEKAKEWISAGKSFTDFAKMFSRDFEQLNGKDNEYETYKRSNPDLPEAALKYQFEQEYEKKYSSLLEYEKITDPDEKQEFYEDNKFHIDGQKAMREASEAKAKQENLKWIDESISKPVEQAPQMSEEEIMQRMKEYREEIDKNVASYKGYNFDFGENQNFNIGLTDESKREITDIAHDPQKLNTFIGDLLGAENVQVTGEMKDYNKLVTFVHKMKTIDASMKQVKDFILENNKIETIEAKRENPLDLTPSNDGNLDSAGSLLSDLMKDAQL